MEAVKMQDTVQVKTRTVSRATAAESAARNDGFVKLLQEKKDLAEPKKAETDKAQNKTDQGKKTEDSAPEKTQEKPGKPEASEEDVVLTEDMTGEDALLQAMLQQAAAQMTGILPEAQQPVQEAAVQAAGEDGIAPVESLPEEGQIQAAEQAVQKPEEKAEALSVQPEEKGQESSAKEEKPSTDLPQNVPVTAKETAPEPKVQIQKSSQPAVQEEKKVQAQEHSQQPVYGTESAGEEPRQVVMDKKAEEIPLKTTQADLPQDLGKTLAAKLPQRGGELTIELEPAALGKLTIKLVYEGERAAVSILSSNPRTLELLSQRAGEIASILEEKTGQETIIYTQPSEQQNEQDHGQNPDGHSSRQNQEKRQENQSGDRNETESFAQQLRLGLV